MINIDHLTLAAKTPIDAASATAAILGLTAATPDHRGFVSVEVSERFFLLYVPATEVQTVHVAFHVDEPVVDHAIATLRDMQIPFGSDPRDPENGRDDHPFGGRGIYFTDAAGHFFELMTTRALE